MYNQCTTKSDIADGQIDKGGPSPWGRGEGQAGLRDGEAGGV